MFFSSVCVWDYHDKFLSSEKNYNSEFTYNGGWLERFEDMNSKVEAVFVNSALNRRYAYTLLGTPLHSLIHAVI